MILWKSVLQHREDIGADVILADRDVLYVEDLSIGYRHEICLVSDGRWASKFDDWTVGINWMAWRFGYWSDYYDCEHHCLSFGPFYVYWSQ